MDNVVHGHGWEMQDVYIIIHLHNTYNDCIIYMDIHGVWIKKLEILVFRTVSAMLPDCMSMVRDPQHNHSTLPQRDKTNLLCL